MKWKLALCVLLAASAAAAAFGLVPRTPQPAAQLSVVPTQTQTAALAPEGPSILFVGDIMLDRAVARHAATAGTSTLFAGILPLFSTADVNVANLEGPITTNPSIAQQNPSILHFTFDPALAHSALAPLHLAAVTLANNHAYDFGIAGYDATREYLSAWGIAPFGHPYNATSSLSTMLTARGKSICLIGYHALYDPSTSSVVAEIERLRPACYRIVVFAHWGVEYQATSTPAQKDEAHQFVDAGADLVVGAHPHVVENIEVYRGKAIFYSLGNFMFDQNFSWETEHGLAVRVQFNAASTDFTLTPVTVSGEEVTPAAAADAGRTLEALGTVAQFSLP